MTSINVVTSSQLSEMRRKVAPAPQTKQSARLEELHQLSKTRAAGWPNTLEAQRARRERIREERLAATERIRQKQDEEAAEQKAAERQALMGRVHKELFNRLDDTKGLKASALLCDVLSERQAQIELRHQVRALELAQEQAFQRQRAEQLSLAEDAELQRLMEVRQRAKAEQAAQLQQLEEVKAGILAERAADKREGELVREKAVQEAADAMEKAKQKRARAKQANADTAHANDVLRALRVKEAEREAQVNMAIEAWRQKKEELATERVRRARAREDAKEAKRKEMVRIMESKFAEFQSDEAARLERDVKAAEDSQAAKAAEKARRQAEEWDAVCASRSQQLLMRQKVKQREVEEDTRRAEDWKSRMAELVAESKAEEQARRQQNRQNAEFLVHQAECKQQRRAAEALRVAQEAAMREVISQEGKERFEQYAQQLIDSYRQQGKPTKPMEIQLDKTKHEVLQSA